MKTQSSDNDCPCCGKRLERISGLRACKCGYIERDWDDGRPRDQGHILPTKGSDEQ